MLYLAALVPYIAEVIWGLITVTIAIRESQQNLEVTETGNVNTTLYKAQVLGSFCSLIIGSVLIALSVWGLTNLHLSTLVFGSLYFMVIMLAFLIKYILVSFLSNLYIKMVVRKLTKNIQMKVGNINGDGQE